MRATKTNFMNKKDFAWLFACIVLVVLLIISVILGLTGFYSSVTYLKSSTDLTVGDTVVVKVEENQASVVSFTVDGSYLPGESIPQVVQICAQNLDDEIYVRVKAEVFGLEGGEFDFTTTSHFQKAEDGYYYFDEVLSGGNKITFCTNIITPQDGSFVSEEKYILSIVVETVDADYVENIWGISESEA